MISWISAVLKLRLNHLIIYLRFIKVSPLNIFNCRRGFAHETEDWKSMWESGVLLMSWQVFFYLMSIKFRGQVWVCSGSAQTSVLPRARMAPSRECCRTRRGAVPLPQSLLLDRDISGRDYVDQRYSWGDSGEIMLLPFSQRSILHQSVLQLSCKLYRSVRVSLSSLALENSLSFMIFFSLTLSIPSWDSLDFVLEFCTCFCI